MESGRPEAKVERERFKSEGETQVARLLDRFGISYLYEHPLAVVDRGKVRIWYPDFQLVGYGILIEYCGRTGDPAYTAGVRRKQAVYQANGLTGIMLTPEALRGDWPGKILGRIEETLAERLYRFQRQSVSPAGERVRFTRGEGQ
jgi:hypothetical protein